MLSKWCTKFRMTYMFLGFCGRREEGNISNVRWFGALNMYVNLQRCPFSWAVKDVGQERQRTQETFAFEFQRVLNCWARRWRKCICSNSFSREYQNRLCQHHNNNAVWGWKLWRKTENNSIKAITKSPLQPTLYRTTTNEPAKWKTLKSGILSVVMVTVFWATSRF